MNKSRLNHRMLLAAAILFAGIFVTGNGHARNDFAGSIDQKLKVTGCGQGNIFLPATTRLEPSKKKWSTSTADGNFGGIYKKRSGGRNLILKFSKSGEKVFTRNLRNWATDLCGARVTISNLKYDIKVKLNKKRTTMKGNIKATARGRTSEGSGKGTYNGKIKMNTI